MLETIVIALLAALCGATAWFFLGMWIKSRWPAQIPPHLRFEHELRSDRKLRAVAEMLAERFESDHEDEVVCLGPVRGSAARVLFHAGPKNTGRDKNIHRHDYVLHVTRVDRGSIGLRLETNRPYSYYRISEREVETLRQALDRAYGTMTEI